MAFLFGTLGAQAARLLRLTREAYCDGKNLLHQHQQARRLRSQRAAIIFLMFLFLGLFISSSVTAQIYQQKIRTFHTAEEFKQLTKGNVRIHRSANYKSLYAGSPAEYRATETGIIYRKSPTSAFEPLPLQLPQNKISVVMELPLKAGLLVGTQAGVIRADFRTQQNQYFFGKRWLNDDKVTGIGLEQSPAFQSAASEIIWVETPKGFSRIEYKPMTLAEKSRSFVERVQKRHNRWGLTADSHLLVPGDLSSNQMVSSDNDGLWTAMYVAAECFRYKVTGEPDARENARVGMNAIMRLEEISGIPGFHARSFIKIGTDLQPGDGEWHDTPDKIWRWKGDTSSDEIVGHYFIYPIYFDLVADEAEKIKLRGVIDRMTNHILDHNYQLVDLDGKRTMWGYWGPDQIWNDPDETGLRALHILAHLRVAIHMTADEKFRVKYQSAYDDLVKNHKYHLLTRNQKIMVPGHINHSDDELAFLSYYPLLQYETDAKLLEAYKDSLERSWLIERPERSPLWNFIYAIGCSAKDFAKDEAVRTLQEIPMDLVEWTVKNSHRKDVLLDPMNDRHKRKQALTVLPYDELPMSKWNGNPYNLDGGNGGRSEDDGAYFLLPYWMGRYHKLIGE